jgi:hypothetical protein
MTHSYNSSYLGGQPGRVVHETPISTITRAKWARGVAQVVEHLFCNCEAVNSNTSPVNKTTKKIKVPRKNSNKNIIYAYFYLSICLSIYPSPKTNNCKEKFKE